MQYQTKINQYLQKSSQLQKLKNQTIPQLLKAKIQKKKKNSQKIVQTKLKKSLEKLMRAAQSAK
jgi:hypothetical protein